MHRRCGVMHFMKTPLVLFSLFTLTLSACGPALPPQMALPGSALRSQSAAANLNNAGLGSLYQQYRQLSWAQQADAKRQLLQRLASMAPPVPRTAPGQTRMPPALAPAA